MKKTSEEIKKRIEKVYIDLTEEKLKKEIENIHPDIARASYQQEMLRLIEARVKLLGYRLGYKRGFRRGYKMIYSQAQRQERLECYKKELEFLYTIRGYAGWNGISKENRIEERISKLQQEIKILEGEKPSLKGGKK